MDQELKSYGAVMDFLRDYSVDVIFANTVTVGITVTNIYANVNILWDEVISENEYHDLGLYGYYSSKFYDIDYKYGALKISGNEGIEISIWK